MLLKVLSALLLTVTSTLVAAESSPLFMLASTADIAVSLDSTNPDVQASDVQHSLWGYLSTCPTKHYAVVVEPLVLSYPSTALIPNAHNARVLFTAEHYDGKVNLVHVLNTILMDCLHHGVLRVEELDTSPDALSMGGPRLDREVAEKSIFYANMPEVDVELTRREYVHVMDRRKAFVEGLLDTYFDEENYTLIYIREKEVLVGPVIGEHEDGTEAPLVGEHTT